MKKLIISIGIVVVAIASLLLLTVERGSNSNSRVYQAPDKSFTVTFPGVHQKYVSKASTPNARFYWDAKKGLQFQSEFWEKKNNPGFQGAADHVMDRILTSQTFTTLKTRKFKGINVNGHPGRDYLLEDSTGHKYRMILVVSNELLIFLSVQSEPKSNIDDIEVSKFLGSLTLIK